jgi:hypothetical protein
MLSFESLALRRAVNRARQLHATGDAVAARDELDALVTRHPKSSQGWAWLLWAVGEAGGSIEDRLDVLRRATEAVPYEQALVEAAVGDLTRAALLIGDRRYLDDAAAVLDRFEDLLGPSIESMLLRAGLAQLGGDEGTTLETCERAEEKLRDHPNPRSQLKLGFCLSSITGQEQRGVGIAEEAAAKLRDPAAYVYLAAVVEDRDPEAAGRYLDEARRFAKNRAVPESYVEGAVAQAREDIRMEREFLRNV